MTVPVQGDASQAVDLETEARRQMVRRAMRIGSWIWPSFTLLDAWMAFVAYPGAPFGLFLVYRALGWLMLFGVYRASFLPAWGIERLEYAQDLTFGLVAVGIALMAVHLGGIQSPYMHGVSIVALVRASLVPQPWRRALPAFLRIGLAFPLVMGLGAVLSPVARESWLTRPALVDFASNFVFVLASSFLGLFTSHVVWATQQQVYRARRLGRYRLQAPIGKGGMGEVWLAWDQSLRRNVALKLLRLGERAGPDMVKRFEREALAASQLRGPHTVQIYDFGASDDGIYYLAMEYLDGTDLRSLVTEFGPLPPARAVRFLLQACASLAEAHAAGIIHRDLKPHNLFVTRVGGDPDFIKLLDFGLVRRHGRDASDQQLTRTGFLAGTPAYMAPELWEGRPADERSDIYALGVTLYYLVTGTVPFEPWSVQDMMRAHLEAQPPSPNQTRATPLPGSLESVLLRCLAKRPEDRFQSVTELAAALERACDPAGWTAPDAEVFWQGVRRRRPA